MSPGFLARYPNSLAVPPRAVVTSGGRVDGAFAAAIGTSIKALAPLGPGVLIDPVLAALRGAGIEEIAVVGGVEVAAHLAGSAVRLIDATENGAANVARALDAWDDGDVIVAASDLPFVDAGAVASFLAASAPFGLTMPLATADAYASAYPGAPAHVTDVAGERVANGSVFFVAEASVAPLRAVAGRFFEQRKSLIGMARLLGPDLLLRFVFRRLHVADIERRARAALGVDAVAIRDAAPALCYDIDTLDDYRYACARR